MTWKYSIHVRCACTGADGKLLGQNCPQLWRRDGGWNTRHGSAGFAGRVETSSGRKMFRRFGYATKTEAEEAARHVGDLAETDADRGRIGDMITAIRRGAPLPSADGIRRRLGLDADPSQPGLTVGEWLDTWLAAKRRTKRESTCRGYEMHIRTWLKPQLGYLPLERLNAKHIEELFTMIWRVNVGVARQRAAGVAPMDVKIDGDVRGQSRECGPTTQLRVFATLRAALNSAVKQRKITRNPASGVELDSAEARERQRWSPNQAAQFIVATNDDPMGLMFRVAVLRGCRRGELCGFHWADAELDKPYRDPATGEERTGALLTVERPIVSSAASCMSRRPRHGPGSAACSSTTTRPNCCASTARPSSSSG